MMDRAIWRGLMLPAAVVCVVFSGARAEQGGAGDYVALRLVGGVSALDGVSDNGDPGVFGFKQDDDLVGGTEIAVGYDWSWQNLPVRTEVEYTYRYRFDFDSRVNGGTDSGFANNLSTHSLMVNALYDFNTSTRFQPYVGAGIGWARNSSDTDQISNNENFCCTESRTDIEDNFAWSLLAGVIYRPADDWRLELGYRYINLGEVESGPFSDGVRITADEYTSHDLIFSVIYRFYASRRGRL
jgi:opacity protein-like surface antigen